MANILDNGIVEASAVFKAYGIFCPVSPASLVRYLNLLEQLLRLVSPNSIQGECSVSDC